MKFTVADFLAGDCDYSWEKSEFIEKEKIHMSVDLKMTPADAVLAIEKLYRDLSDRLVNEGKDLIDKLRSIEVFREPLDLREADLSFSIDGSVPYDDPSQIGIFVGSQQIGWCNMIKPVGAGRYRFLIYGYKLKEPK